MEFGKVISVPLRDLWQGEATHFTPWLAKNLDILSEKIGLELDLEEVEASAGDFSVDIVARDLSTNKLVVIENQYGLTDHKHLGQVVTYSSELGAAIVIWIAESIRPEHKRAIDFLNNNLKSSLQLYAIEAGIIKIDDSKPAFELNLVCMPNVSALTTSAALESTSETKEKYRTYFQSLIDELRINHHFTNAKAGQPQNWYTFSSENSKIYKYSTSFAHGGRVRAEIYLDSGNKEKNEAIFDSIYQNKIAIENEFGSSLTWEKLDNKRASRIAIYRDGDIDSDSETLTDIKNWTIANLLKLKKILPNHIETALNTIMQSNNHSQTS
ncbi:MAG TPA: DUF4268 domain-containing protein [Cellvibrionaceae bacterium]|nr:DUF4268 domain-containing protein [Cellvibrionaceae bacterium]HMW73200.1 DUF4268 domain-containing protein [Cellvibrionaceae bacterium]HNG59870.1 DUF4268 domain-containing protein [Cellvibrionaceae bacterium]